VDTFFQLFQFELPSWYHGIFDGKVGSEGEYAFQSFYSEGADLTPLSRRTSSPQKQPIAQQSAFG